MTCERPATEQFVFLGDDGLHHISVPLCEEHSDDEQPGETHSVHELTEDHECLGADEPPWDRCLCHPERAE